MTKTAGVTGSKRMTKTAGVMGSRRLEESHGRCGASCRRAVRVLDFWHSMGVEGTVRLRLAWGCIHPDKAWEETDRRQPWRDCVEQIGEEQVWLEARGSNCS